MGLEEDGQRFQEQKIGEFTERGEPLGEIAGCLSLDNRCNVSGRGRERGAQLRVY